MLKIKYNISNQETILLWCVAHMIMIITFLCVVFVAAVVTSD